MVLNTRTCLAAILLLGMASCVKEDYNIDKISSSIDVTTSVGLPIASGSVTLKQLLPESSDTTNYIYVDNDNLLHLVYKQTLDSLTFGKYANIVKDMQSSTTIAAPNGVSFPSNTTTPGNTNFTLNISLDNNDQSIDEALLESGLLSVSSSATFSGSFSYTIVSQDIVDVSNQPLSITFSQSKSINLAGYKIKPYSGKQIRFSIGYSITKYGNCSNDEVTLSFNLSGIKVKELVGDLGQIQIPLQNNSLPLDISKMVDNVEDFDIKNPNIRLIFKNQACLPFAFTHSGVTATKDNVTYTITGLPSPINILSPTFGVEKEKISYATIDPNSNLVSVLAKFPKTLDFNGRLVTNPSSLPTVKNRINTKDKLYIGAAADLPLNIRLTNLTLKDTTEYDFASVVKDSKSIDILKLQFQFKNGFPLDLDISAAVVDADGNILDQIFLEPFKLKAAATQNEKATIATESKTEVIYNQARIQKLKAGNRIVFTTKANTAGNSTSETVKLLSSYKMDIKVVGFIQANLNNL